MHIEPVVLSGRVIRLEPLSPVHVRPLAEVGCVEEIWRWNPWAVVRTEADMRSYVATALRQFATNHALPFATVEQSSGHAVGSTRFANFDHENRRVEIGSTWIAPRWQRTAVNTEAKYLMLRHAFETWDCLRVEFKTDSLNLRSRAALRRLGATEEGTFRNHMLTHSGRIRHSVYFSIIDTEWPAVKDRLEAILAAGPHLGATERPAAGRRSES